MRRTRILAAGFVALVCALALPARLPARAQPAPGDAAYYIVVLPAAGSGGTTLQISQVSDNSGTHVQVSGNVSVDCTRYGSEDDANAAAGTAHAGANWTVVQASDALHALLIATGTSPELASLVPAAPDSDVCTAASTSD